MKKKLAMILPVLVLLIGAGITAKTLYTFNPDRFLEDVADTISTAESVKVNVDGSLTGGTPRPVSFTLSGMVVFPSNYKVDGSETVQDVTQPVSEVATSNFLYRKDSLTEGKWVRLEKGDREGFAKDRLNIKFTTLGELVRSVKTIERNEVADGMRTVSGPLDWRSFIAAVGKEKDPDWIAAEFPAAKSAVLTLSVDEATGFVSSSKLSLKDNAGKQLELKMTYAEWNTKKTGIIEPAAAEVVPKEEAERMLKARQRYKAGLISYQADNYSRAVTEFGDAISYQPRNYTYNVWLAKAQLKKGNYDEAELYATKAISMVQTRAEAYIVASQVYAIDDQWQPARRSKAIEYAQQAVKVNSGSSEAYTALAFAYYLKALPSFEDSVTVPVDHDLTVKDESPVVPEGFLRNRAFVSIDKAIELNPADPEAHFLKGFMTLSDVARSFRNEGVDPENLIHLNGEAIDSLERAAESFATVERLKPGFLEAKLEPTHVWFASAFKDDAVTQKFAKFKMLTDRLLYDGARWRELGSTKKEETMKAWFEAYKDYVVFAYSLSGSQPPMSYYDRVKQIDDTLKIIYGKL
ncbi:MAG: tetratricopeptide repeat protein [Candidatus Aquicultorales bacterium]